jgi:hypothetical protein
LGLFEHRRKQSDDCRATLQRRHFSSLFFSFQTEPEIHAQKKGGLLSPKRKEKRKEKKINGRVVHQSNHHSAGQICEKKASTEFDYRGRDEKIYDHPD